MRPVMGIVTAGGLLLTVEREVRHAFEVTDNAREVIHIARMAVRTLLEVTLVDGAAVVAERIGNVVSEIVTSLMCRHTEQLTVLGGRKMLVEIHVEGRSAGEVLDVLAALETE